MAIYLRAAGLILSLKSLKLPLSLNNHHAKKAYGRAEAKLQALLTSALDGGGGVYGRIILK
jgi:hypothetical protein